MDSLLRRGKMAIIFSEQHMDFICHSIGVRRSLNTFENNLLSCMSLICQAYWGRRTKLQLKSHEDYIEYNLNYPYREVPGEKTDLGAGNPVYSGDLSQQQLQTCVSLKYRIMGIKIAKFSVLLRCFSY